MTKSILQVIRRLSMLLVPVLAVLAGITCSGRRETEDPGAALALIAGKMARENDLQSVVFEDLDGDGTREVILVYGPRELLNFDVYYNSDGEWLETPMVNDQGNPREFKGAMLDSIRDQDADRRSEIRVSSRLYDGNSLVKELHWSPEGYQVIGQRTVLLRKPAEVKPAAPGKTAADTAAAAEKPPEKPEPKPYRPLTPEKAVYLVRKGDTVYGLARLFEVSFEGLEALNDNQLSARGLRIGQRINVPTPSRRNSAFTVRIDRENHEVSPGENLTSIARHYGVSVRALMSWNPELPEDGTIKVGQRLKIHRALVDIKQ
ncbi:MAG: LysM peptidoglycan-binding domain-containing protein [Candidatus Glassbacteria bacterium]|nr:LysM peptidoglycan-binding domain-containing protein [Candidatus Glassbacteria bacterium]